ncbi:hypothetical protein [Diaphorobacter caeni]|uniref:hypothetical protein n=1 Tax=Diaphorobacter caeni TaxID=2784387 RepID=UPI00188F6FE3|nr:hypothetical protein [Diaphorobacter caeni]MBF5007826.1 hypothetical protein [Diaphorobacter caeni]
MSKNKPRGRIAKRIEFYTRNRRKAQGRSVLKQLRAVLPAVTEKGVIVDAMPFGRDEWESPNFHAFHYGDNIMLSINHADIESARSLPISEQRPPLLSNEG